jgi:hypothetical protein
MSGIQHIVGIPSWYGTARGPGGGYFRDQALALQAAGFRIAMLAPDIHTLRDLRQGRVPAARRGGITVEDDGIPTWRRSGLVLIPRVPYRNALAWAWGGLKLFARYRAENGAPDLVHAHCMLNAGVVALAIRRRYGIPYIVTEQSTSFAQGTLRGWERDLVRRVIAGADKCIPISEIGMGLPAQPARRSLSVRRRRAGRSQLRRSVCVRVGRPHVGGEGFRAADRGLRRGLWRRAGGPIAARRRRPDQR